MISVAIAFGIIAIKAMVTGLGLATGFAIISGVPGMVHRIADARIDGRSVLRQIPPPWFFELFGFGISSTEEQDESVLNPQVASAS